MEFKKSLDDAIEVQFEELDKCEVGTEVQRNAAEVVAKLMDRAIEIEKIEIGREERKLELAKMKDEKIDRWVRNGTTIGIALLQVGLTVWGTRVCLKFEETGTVTTSVGRNFLSRLFSKK